MESAIERHIRLLWNEAFNARELDVLDAITAPAFYNHNALPGTPLGPEGHRQVVERLWEAVPDARCERHLLAEAGDTVIWVGGRGGPNGGTLMAVAPPGRRVEWRQCHLYRFD